MLQSSWHIWYTVCISCSSSSHGTKGKPKASNNNHNSVWVFLSISVTCKSLFPSLYSNKGMDHLSTMKRKNVVLVYDLLLEMLDANTSSSSSQPSSSPSSDTYSDQHQYPQTPSHLQPGSDQTTADHTAVPPHGPAGAPILDGHLQALPLQSSPPFQGLVVAHMDSNE